MESIVQYHLVRCWPCFFTFFPSTVGSKSKPQDRCACDWEERAMFFMRCKGSSRPMSPCKGGNPTYKHRKEKQQVFQCLNAYDSPVPIFCFVGFSTHSIITIPKPTTSSRLPHAVFQFANSSTRPELYRTLKNLNPWALSPRIKTYRFLLKPFSFQQVEIQNWHHPIPSRQALK